jgi:ribosomal 30S subunit maturation factor RimM
MTDDLVSKAVFTYDDERLGTVQEVVTARDDRRYLVVTSSLFGTGTYYVPESEVRTIGPERVLLNTTRDDLRELDWFAAPEGIE